MPVTLWAPDGKTRISSSPQGSDDHFATRKKVNDFLRLMKALPDPDPILQKMGKGIGALRDLLTDSHLESVWSVRCSAVSGAAWLVIPGADGTKETQAAELFNSLLSGIDIPRIIEEMMEGVAFGYSPLEVLWTVKDSKWLFSDIVGKPSEWFEFDQENRLVIKTGVVGTEEVPANRFLLVQHRPSYANPYGVKAFSKCFWPVTFKKNGFRWWTVFVEKYGGAFLYGKYPNNASDEYKNNLLDSLVKMVADAVAVAPEDSNITIAESGKKGESSSVYSEYIRMANAEISKVILGQTLTTEIGDVGSRAAAQTHNLIREDLATSDRKRIASAFNRLSRIFTIYNFGEDVAAPVFIFQKEEDLKRSRVIRDNKLYTMGFRPRKAYIAREYGIPEDEFDMDEKKSSVQGMSVQTQETQRKPKSQRFTKIRKFFSWLYSAFVSDNERKKQDRLMAEFSDGMIRQGQEDTDETIRQLSKCVQEAETFEDAFSALASSYPHLPVTKLAHLVDEIRYAAGAIGADGER